MRILWLRMAVLVIAMIVVHEGWMATSGHAAVAAGNASLEQEPGGAHRHHQAPGAREHQPADPAGPAGHCDPLRVVAPLNRDMSPSFDTVPTALIPDSTILMRFAATSRDLVETPPAHPPDLIRAFFQVYLI